MPLRLLLDENISPRLVGVLWGYGIDTVHLRDRNMLEAPDHEVWRFALDERRAVATINAVDFRRLAARTAHHHGVIAIPSNGRIDQQRDYLLSVHRWTEAANYTFVSPLANRFVQVQADFSVISIEIRLEEDRD